MRCKQSTYKYDKRLRLWEHVFKNTQNDLISLWFSKINIKIFSRMCTRFSSRKKKHLRYIISNPVEKKTTTGEIVVAEIFQILIFYNDGKALRNQL